MSINFADTVTLLRRLCTDSQETLVRRAGYVHQQAQAGKLNAGVIAILSNALTWKQVADETILLLDQYEATREVDEQQAQQTLLAEFRFKATQAAMQQESYRAERWLNHMNLFYGSKSPYETDWI
jgi:hypothetical protein